MAEAAEHAEADEERGIEKIGRTLPIERQDGAGDEKTGERDIR